MPDDYPQYTTGLFGLCFCGELSEEAKDAFFTAVTKAYLECKEEARKTFGRKKK